MNRKEELKCYLKEVANPTLQKLVADLLKEKPKKSELARYCRDWFQKQMEQSSAEVHTSDDEADHVCQLPQSAQTKKKVRKAVSAEAYGEYNKKEDFKPNVIAKPEATKKRILVRLKESFLFRSLQEKETDIVISAMEERKFAAGEAVIRQGDDGDVLYVVDAGELDCYKTFGSQEKHLKVYKPGEAFGELALLYNAPRAATIISKGESVLFALDRQTFNNIVKDAAQKKRKIYEEVLSKVDILKETDPYEKNQIADVLKDLNVSVNDQIIHQGQAGDKFYIVVKGQFAATKKNERGEEKTVHTYKEGDYFVQLALLKNIPRQASVTALTSGKLVYIERDAFKRVLGPVQDILQRNAQAYEKYRAV